MDRQIQLDDKVAIITMTQGDFQYLQEWIEYHRSIGVDLILIAYNGDKAKFHNLPQYDYVRYFDFSTNDDDDTFRWLDIKKVDRPFSTYDSILTTLHHESSLQTSVLNLLVETIKHCYKDIHWCCPIDTDEFINLLDGSKTISEFFKKNFPEDIQSYHILMRFYGDNGLIYNDGRPCLERFTKPGKICDKYEWYAKVVLNLRHKHMKIGFLSMMQTPHTCGRTDFAKCKFDTNKIELKHFSTKTLEEWIMKFDPQVDRDYANRFWNKIFDDFFYGLSNNEITTEKLKAIPKLLEKYNIDYHPETDEDNIEFVELYKRANNL